MRDQHRDWLAEHRGLSFDTAHAPAEHAEAIDHSRVRVCAHNRIRIGRARAVLVGVEDDAAQVLEIHLVNNARVGRHDAEIVERRLTPLEERVALLIALEFDLGVEIERIRSTVVVNLHRVVDDEFRR